jgi:hypothetical protein
LRLGGTGADCFDGIDGNYWRREQLAGAGDVLGTFPAGESVSVKNSGSQSDAITPFSLPRFPVLMA